MGLLAVMGYAFGLTQETKVEVGPVLEDEAVVDRKEHIPANPWENYSSIGLPYSSLGQPSVTEERYAIIFESERNLFRVESKELHSLFEEGDEVTVFYRNLCKHILDYKPPDFNSKKLIGQETRQEFAGVQKRD